MDFIFEMRKKIADPTTRIVFPEGEELTILQAAVQIQRLGIARVILLGKEEVVSTVARENQIGLEGIRLINPMLSSNLDGYVERYCGANPDFPAEVARVILEKNLAFGAMMVREGDADIVIGGIFYTTSEVITTYEFVIGLQEGISAPSSFMVFCLPKKSDSFGDLLICADPAINPDPDPELLADIAITTARSVTELQIAVPRVALLSFSTLGSATHPMVDKVQKALEIARTKDPSIQIDGEFQLDAAIIPEVAKRKIKRQSDVAGRANVLIFPDLNSGNIACKIIQRLGKAQAYGAVLQGFAKCACDLSRGATVEDIIGLSTILVVQKQGEKR
jgi:phosphate acetyltransferase